MEEFGEIVVYPGFLRLFLGGVITISMEDKSRGIDYYGVLGLIKSASDTEIKIAYRRLAIEYNPERQKDPDLHELFCLVGEAYEVLSHPLRKAIYDQYGEAGMKKGVLTPLGWHPAWNYHGDPLKTYKKFYGTASPYADLLDELRKSFPNIPTQQEAKVKGPATERTLLLELKDVLYGCLKKIKIRRREFVDKENTKTEARERILSIHVKPGIPTGAKITYPEVGDEGPSIIPGDMIFTVQIKKHHKFNRSGNDLVVDLNVDLKQSLQGMNIKINTLDGRVIRFSVTDVIDQNYVKVIKGEGLPFYENPKKKGNLIFKFDVTFPSVLPQSVKDKIIGALDEIEKPSLDDLDEQRQTYLAMTSQTIDWTGGIELLPPSVSIVDTLNFTDLKKVPTNYVTMEN